MQIKAMSVLLSTFLFFGSVRAALPPRTSSEKPGSIETLKQVKLILHETKELDLRLAKLKELGPNGYRSLVSLSFDPQNSMEERWKGIMAMAGLGGKLSLPELERALNSNSWELRSSALKAIADVDRQAAIRWAEKLLKDNALIVRLAAVEVAEETRARELLSVLWGQLESQKNFRRKQGLFIRNRIVEALGALETPGSERKFIALLNEPDVEIHRAAIKALEKVTGQELGRPGDVLARRRALWIGYKSSSRVQ